MAENLNWILTCETEKQTEMETCKIIKLDHSGVWTWLRC